MATRLEANNAATSPSTSSPRNDPVEIDGLADYDMLVGETIGGDLSRLALYAIRDGEVVPVWFNEYERIFERADDYDDDSPYTISEIYDEELDGWKRVADEKLEPLGLKLGEWHEKYSTVTDPWALSNYYELVAA